MNAGRLAFLAACLPGFACGGADTSGPAASQPEVAGESRTYAMGFRPPLR